MVKKWKIILSIFLVIAICFTTASASIESPFTKSSFDKSSATAFAEAKASAMENMKSGFEKPAFNPPDPVEKTEFPDVSVDLSLPEIRPPFIFPTPLPTRTFPTPPPIQRVPAITMSEALEIAATYGAIDNPLCPGITAFREMLRIDGKIVKVWRVSGKCGSIVYLDMYSGELVKSDAIGCVCIDIIKAT